jgi:hypothetical protein
MSADRSTQHTDEEIVGGNKSLAALEGDVMLASTRSTK